MGAYRAPVEDPPGWDLRLEWTDRATRRAVGRLVGPDVEHSGTGLYAYLETRRGDEWVVRFQLRQVGAAVEGPEWVEVGPDGRAFELDPLELGGADIVLVIPPIEPGEHRIRKGFTILDWSITLHARIPDDRPGRRPLVERWLSHPLRRIEACSVRRNGCWSCSPSASASTRSCSSRLAPGRRRGSTRPMAPRPRRRGW